MSEHAKIEKDGIWSYKWDGDAREYKKRKPKYIWTLLRCSCEIEEGVTLRDIFDAVEAFPELKEFISQYAWCGHIDEFHEDARKPIPFKMPDQEEAPLDYLEIHWHASTHHFKGKNTIDLTADFHGIGKPDDHGFTGYSVSYSPMWELAHLPVKLNTRVEIYRPYTGAPKLLFVGEREFSLLDVLDAIYDDISFMGGPADNAAFLEEMKDTTEKIKSGELKCVPWEELDLDDDEDEEEADPRIN